MSIPHNLESSFRVHDEAVLNWLKNLKVDYGVVAGTSRDNTSVLTVFASPDRAFANVSDLLIARGWIPGADAATRLNNVAVASPILPLPLISVERSGLILDPELSGTPKSFRAHFYDRANGVYIDYLYPGHYKVEYRLTTWSEKRYSDVYMSEWIHAQLGLAGNSAYECLIPVVHDPLIGTLHQQWKLTNVTDLSSLESSNEIRYIRSSYSFSLRFWFFRKLLVGGPPVYEGQTIVEDDLNVSETFPDSGVFSTWNLFSLKGWQPFQMNNWPVNGNGTAAYSYDVDGNIEFSATITVPSDSVRLVRADSIRDSFGVSLWMVSFAYSSKADFQVVSSQTDNAAVESPNWAFTVPANDSGKIQKFLVNTGYEGIFNVTGTGASTTATLSDLEIRQIHPKKLLGPSTAVPGGGSYGGVPGDRVYVFSNLENRPYLVVGVSTSATDFTVTLQDDATTPDTSRSEAVPHLTQHGFVLLSMPLSNSLRLIVSPSVVISSLYAAPFDEAFTGSTV